MKVLHLTGWPIPETVGGTEVYVVSLCRALAAEGVECAVGFPSRDGPRERGEEDGLSLHSYGPVTGAAAADGFAGWLKSLRPDVVHAHSVTEGLALPELEAVHRAGYPLVMTVHVPGVVCHRGTMLRDGREPCDGAMRLDRCCHCTLQNRGLPAAAGRLLQLTPRRLREGAAAVLPRKVATALRMPSILERWFADSRRVLSLCGRVVAVCQWLFDALRLNGVPEDRLVLSRQATDLPHPPPARRARHPNEPLRVGYLGRFDPIKGVHVLVRSVAGLPRRVPVRLELRGAAAGPAGARYLQRLRRLAGGDGRIEIGGPLPRERLASFLGGTHALAVPSTLLETGPLVAYEALAHRVPVLGSRLGGIAELVRDGSDGWLLPAGDVGAWRRHIAELASGAHPLPPAAVPSPVLRDWVTVAREMGELYSQMTGRPAAAPCVVYGPT
jgi:glycosyltransferase involved in cell wall biosynthesis